MKQKAVKSITEISCMNGFIRDIIIEIIMVPLIEAEAQG
jgi:hypothetical protein